MGGGYSRRGLKRYTIGIRPRPSAGEAGAPTDRDRVAARGGAAFHQFTPLIEHSAILLERTDRRYATREELIDAFAWIDGQLALVAAPDRRFLLVDTRATTGRNDPQFEQAMAPLRRQLQANFERVAVVLRSTIGRMQVERYARDDGDVPLRAFTSYEEALGWLTKS
ncbi:MAG: hypothetical protein B7733_19740 [Myxococcales bacterium FL481]|nr:MAG: hypothetical protein B7733_19740 [Myxococcales bacterium FL481]